MKTDQEHFLKSKLSSQRGSGLVYVLIAVALFAALSFTLMRTTDTSEAGTLSDEKAELYASQLINYAAQAKSVVDQMTFAGTDLDDIDFSLPGTAAFNAGSHTAKIYHPEGGGLTPGKFPDAIIEDNGDATEPGWRLGRTGFNIEWTETSDNDILLSAYKIAQSVCEKLNVKITGTTTIPAAGSDFYEYIGGGSALDSTECPACEGYYSICVQDLSGNYAFYSIVGTKRDFSSMFE